MNWREEYKRKLTSPEEAVKEIKSGDTVMLAHSVLGPYTLCQALGKRKDELERVTIDQTAPTFPQPWFEADYEKAFLPVTRFISGFVRHLVEEGRLGVHLEDTCFAARQIAERGLQHGRLIFMPRVSPPDELGYCSFGQMLWYAPLQVEEADVVIAEVIPGLIRTSGENYVHVSQIDKFIEAEPLFASPEEIKQTVGLVIKDDKERLLAEIIGATVAGELVRDGDVIQIGAGAISGATAAFLVDKNDLGFHSEILPGGIMDLVRQRVMTGRTKKIHRGKLVATACMGVTEEDLALIDGNPLVELYRVDYVNDPRVISQNDNVVAVNNALAIDLSGQVASDSLGVQMYTGAGGQLDFVLGAALSRGGRSVTVLPSTARDGEVSRIVPTLALGQGVTVPRMFVDYVVTEYGIAKLSSKTLKQRAGELISIAHPDFRSGLRKQAMKLGQL